MAIVVTFSLSLPSLFLFLVLLSHVFMHIPFNVRGSFVLFKIIRFLKFIYSDVNWMFFAISDFTKYSPLPLEKGSFSRFLWIKAFSNQKLGDRQKQ